MKTALAVVLSLPLLALVIAFDIIKLPVVVLVILPVWVLIDLIFWLRGEDWGLLQMAPSLILLGLWLWLDLMDFPVPSWMEP